MPPGAPELNASIVASDTRPTEVLAWRIHLARQTPGRLPGILFLVFSVSGLVWLMFRNPLPALAAAALLLGSVRDYLFPIRYRLTEEGAEAEFPGSRAVLRWKEARRCLVETRQLTLTPLALPSRLDAFRGVTLRFAPEGEPGDRASLLAALARLAPSLALPSGRTTPSETDAASPIAPETASAGNDGL